MLRPREFAPGHVPRGDGQACEACSRPQDGDLGGGSIEARMMRCAAAPAPSPAPTRDRELLIALTRAVDIYANVAEGDPLEVKVWKREIMPAFVAAQEYLLAATPAPRAEPEGEDDE